MAEKCQFCDAPATRWCDNAIALVDTGLPVKVKGQMPYRATSMEAMLSHSYTCDAGFCSEHGHVVGFICGTDPDTIDKCQDCFRTGRGGKGVLLPAAIDAVRKQWHAETRRSRIRIV